VLPVLGHTPHITVALGGLIGRHFRPRELEEIEGLDVLRAIALESRQTNPGPLAGRVDGEGLPPKCCELGLLHCAAAPRKAAYTQMM
jgi:hypothetical protein